MAEPFIGEVDLYGFNFTPENWQPCIGQLLSINSNQAMYSLLGTAFGGDGRTTFGLPDLRGKFAINKGKPNGSSHQWVVGESAGSEIHNLSLNELPSHNHSALYSQGKANTTMSVATESANSDTPQAGYFLAASETGKAFYRADAGTGTVALGGTTAPNGQGSVTLGNSGSARSFSIMQTSLTLNYCIAQLGLYPSRS